MLPLALGNGVAVLVAQAVGARKFDVARSTGITGLGLAVVLALVTSASLVVGAGAITAIYTEDKAVRAVATTLLVLVAAYHVFDALQAVTVSALRGYKRTVVPMIVMAVALWGVGLAGGYVVGLSDALDLTPLGLRTPLGAPGFWIAAAAGLCVAFLATVVYYLVVSAPHHAERDAARKTPLAST
jgi:MATE family multidrug resistance protein